MNSKSSTQSKIPEENYGESEPNFMQLLLSLFFLSKNCWKDWELNVIRIIKTFFNFKKVETKVKVKNDKLLFELEVINTIKNPRRKLWRNWTKFYAIAFIFVLYQQKTVERNWKLYEIRIIKKNFQLQKGRNKSKGKKR